MRSSYSAVLPTAAESETIAVLPTAAESETIAVVPTAEDAIFRGGEPCL